MPWVSQKKLDEMKQTVTSMNAALQDAGQQAYLIGLERKESRNVFTFVRGGQMFIVETFSTLSDNLPQWKKDLLG